MQALAEAETDLNLAEPGSTARVLRNDLRDRVILATQQGIGENLPYIAGGFVSGRLAGTGAEAAASRIGVAGVGAGINAAGGSWIQTQQRLNALDNSGNQQRVKSTPVKASKNTAPASRY